MHCTPVLCISVTRYLVEKGDFEIIEYPVDSSKNLKQQEVKRKRRDNPVLTKTPV
jgi:hypothetical protein